MGQPADPTGSAAHLLATGSQVPSCEARGTGVQFLLAEGVMNLEVGRDGEAALPGRTHAQWGPPPISKSCPGPLPTQTETPNSLDVWQWVKLPGQGVQRSEKCCCH